MTKVTGPKDGEIVVPIFDGKTNREIRSRFPSLADTKDLILLSITGNEFCAGDYLGSLIQHAVTTHQNKNDGTISKGKSTFLIADEIHWHNLKGMSPANDDVSALKSQALALGEQYFKANLVYFLAPLEITLDKFNDEHGAKSIDLQIAQINQIASDQGKNFEIMRWHTWVNQQDADQQNLLKIKEMMPLYESEAGLKASIDEQTEDFALRHSDHGDATDLWKYRSKGYLTEESPSIMWLAAALEYNFIIYPGKMMPSFKATRDFFLAKTHKAQIIDGISVEDVCSHNEFCIHVKDPARLANWLEPNFKRNHPPKVDKMPTPNNLSFFPLASNYKKTIPIEDQEIMPEEIISALLEGVRLALAEKQRVPHKTRGSQTNLTEIFRGITEGILNSTLPPTDKLIFLKGIADSYICFNAPESQPECKQSF